MNENTKYKPLIERASATAFKQFFEQIESIAVAASAAGNSSQLGGIRDEGYLRLNREAATRSFKEFLAAGYLGMMMDLASSNNTEEAQLIHCSHVMTGFSLGFKYASYLHEQELLAELNSTSSEAPEGTHIAGGEGQRVAPRVNIEALNKILDDIIAAAPPLPHEAELASYPTNTTRPRRSTDEKGFVN